MRIVSGSFRGKTLAAPKGEATRPTSDRARQAVFNILEHAAWSKGVRDQRVIDLFAGSGALGFEALSRGAAFCLFVETDEAARGAIRENVEAMGLFGKTRVHRRDATDLGVRPGAVSEILSGIRLVKASEIEPIVTYLELNRVPIMGRVGAGAVIEPDLEQIPPEGLGDIELPFPLAGEPSRSR